MSEERPRRGALLGVIAYVLVPGERRTRAAGHFRKAGFETLKGVGALVRPEKSQESSGPASRERIEIE
ncbi:MAG: hypothetical protein M3514_03610 [Actinomycetota bacterium]|jgi:hypothetical protein|nr:hypothetical protein [Rubrobacteraceae bacterium]MDQ3496600.1 hypothetical protein [Actinomycetota bacterium]